LTGKCPIRGCMRQEPVFFEDRKAWRRWLEKYHDKRSEVWILTFKTHTGRKCVSYSDALDEALCYGWIDSRVRRIDDEKHLWRFAPRRLDSIWSLSNRRRAENLISRGLMTDHGLKKIEAGKRSGEWAKAISPSMPPKMPKEMKEALMMNKKAWKNFQAFAKSYRTTYIYWVLTAKREETKRKRIEVVVSRAERNLKMYMPDSPQESGR
jgi:uncharacterized protein YdeI (YjbR/CyaY-like superfamily)